MRAQTTEIAAQHKHPQSKRFEKWADPGFCLGIRGKLQAPKGILQRWHVAGCHFRQEAQTSQQKITPPFEGISAEMCDLDVEGGYPRHWSG